MADGYLNGTGRGEIRVDCQRIRGARTWGMGRMGIKSIWASVQGDPVFMRRVNGWLTIAWLAMIPISLATGWVKSVTYVSALSLWALVSGHWSAWQAARVEVNQQQEDIPGQVVEQVVAETSVQPAPDAAGSTP